jgi:hypothetical protein
LRESWPIRVEEQGGEDRACTEPLQLLRVLMMVLLGANSEIQTGDHMQVIKWRQNNALKYGNKLLLHGVKTLRSPEQESL